MTMLLTSFIKETPVDTYWLSERFRLVWVSYKDWSDEERRRQLAYLPSRIYRSGKVLSLIQEWKCSRYGILLPEGESMEIDDDSLSVKTEPLSRASLWLVRALLIRAMPRVLGLQDGAERIEADGLHYVTRYVALKGQGSVITSVKINPGKCQVTGSSMLGIHTVTFTPVQVYENEEGLLPLKVARLSRFELDTLSQEVKRSSTGKYVKKALWPKQKNRVPAIKFGSQIALESYYKTRIGVLSMFLEDVQKAYGGALNIELESISPDQHQTIPAVDVKAAYTQLHELMKKHEICVTNHSDDPAAGAKVSEELLSLGVESVQVADVDPDGLNILLVNGKDQYEDSELDPYRVARTRFPDAVIQSCYPERLRSDGRKHVVEVLLKELFIKYEIKNRQLFFDYPSLPQAAWFITSIRPDGKKLHFNAPWKMFYCRVNRRQLEFGLLPQSMIDEMKINFTAQQTKQVFQGYERTDLIYWPDTGNSIIVSDTGALCLPDENKIHTWVKEIDRSVNQGIPVNLIIRYCDRYPDQVLVPQLRSIAASNGTTAPAGVFSKIQYKGEANRHFYDYLAEQGYRLKAGFSAKKTGALQATSGIWIHNERGLYAAGSVGSPSRNMDNFNHIYHVDAGGEPVPDWFWKSLEVWHVRHKGTTVFPYIFKHLREYGQRQISVGKGMSHGEAKDQAWLS